MPQSNRREFLKFIGAAYTSSLLPASVFSYNAKSYPSILPSLEDKLILAPGFSYESLLSWGDRISDADTFGFNCDYTAFIPLDDNTGILWVNHEYINPLFIHGKNIEKKSKAHVDQEMYNMGGSLVEIHRERSGTNWKVKNGSKYNRRITALTKIPFANGEKIMGKDYSLGMVANCAGGVTPWGNVLTCEENFDAFHGERKDSGQKKPGRLQWEKFYDCPPEHYGWVVEVDPRTGSAKNHTSMGRFAHECATTTYDHFGNLVVYSGDDEEDQFLYKFISDNKNSLESGTLYVANLDKSSWIPLDINKSQELKNNFKNQLEVLINCQKAGEIMGATPLDRPEDIEVHPITGEVYICLSNNRKKNNFHGSILKITESKSSPLKFTSEDFLVGGEEFSCPDNLAFDKKGNLWLSCDISGKRIGMNPYEKFGNNGLFFIPTHGPQAGRSFQIASAPKDAELTGITISPDQKSMFLSVQHPGELSRSLENLTSNWPTNKKAAIPKPTVVQIRGPLLK